MENELRALGADEFVCLAQPTDQLTAELRTEIQGKGIDVILDYLWGPPAACILDAISGYGSGAAAPRIRFVNIGALAGATLPMNPGVLRSTGLEMLGTGLGSVSNEKLVEIVGALLQAIEPAKLRVDAEALPLGDVEESWQRNAGERIVFTL